MARKKKGPTPRRRREWKAQCETCGRVDALHPEPSRDPDGHSPCPGCGGETARYALAPSAPQAYASRDLRSA